VRIKQIAESAGAAAGGETKSDDLLAQCRCERLESVLQDAYGSNIELMKCHAPALSV